MTIWCKHVPILDLQNIFLNLCAAHLPVRLGIGLGTIFPGADPGFVERRGRNWLEGEFLGIFRPILRTI